MHADIKGALSNINKGGGAWRVFEHNGKPLSKSEVVKLLEYGINKGYTTTEEFKDQEVAEILTAPHEKIFE